jgi:LPXTG-motif cell wall-anchored protein
VKATSPPPHRRVLALAALLGVVAATLLALVLPATAMATPCGDKVLADWFDNGRIDRLYDLHCYEDAIDAIPADLRDYANAEEIISRALQAAVGGKLDPGGPDPSPDDPRGGGGPSPTDPADPDDSEASPDVDTTGLSSVPIPLIVLGVMSLALLGAGGLGYLRRRNAPDDLDGPDDGLEL